MNVLYFEPWPLQNTVSCNQNKGHLGSRYLFFKVNFRDLGCFWMNSQCLVRRYDFCKKASQKNPKPHPADSHFAGIPFLPVFDVQQGLAIGLFHPADNPQRKKSTIGSDVCPIWKFGHGSPANFLEIHERSYKEEDDFRFTPPMHGDLPRAVGLQGDVTYKRGKTSQGEADVRSMETGKASFRVRTKTYLLKRDAYDSQGSWFTSISEDSEQNLLKTSKPCSYESQYIYIYMYTHNLTVHNVHNTNMYIIVHHRSSSSGELKGATFSGHSSTTQLISSQITFQQDFNTKETNAHFCKGQAYRLTFVPRKTPNF